LGWVGVGGEASTNVPTPLCVANARPFQLGVHFGDGVGVHLEVHGELAHGRQAIADSEVCPARSLPDAAIELHRESDRSVDQKHSSHIVRVHGSNKSGLGAGFEYWWIVRGTDDQF
jgi:hypothetical protein